MFLTALALTIRHQRQLAVLTWAWVALAFLVDTQARLWPLSGSVITTCYYDGSIMCVAEGCFVSAQIRHVGPKRPLFTRTVPTHITIDYKTGYFGWAQSNLTRVHSIECATRHLRKQHSFVMLVALIPSLVFCGALIVLLVSLQPSSPTFTLEMPPEKDEYPMEEFDSPRGTPPDNDTTPTSSFSIQASDDEDDTLIGENVDE